MGVTRQKARAEGVNLGASKESLNNQVSLSSVSLKTRTVARTCLVTRTIADKSGYKFIEEQTTAKDILHRLSAPCNRRKFKGRQTVSHETRVAIDISGPRRACQFREIGIGSRATIAALWRSVSTRGFFLFVNETHSVSAIDVNNVFNSSARLVFMAPPLRVTAQRHLHATRMIFCTLRG